MWKFLGVCLHVTPAAMMGAEGNRNMGAVIRNPPRGTSNARANPGVTAWAWRVRVLARWFEFDDAGVNDMDMLEHAASCNGCRHSVEEPMRLMNESPTTEEWQVVDVRALTTIRTSGGATFTRMISRRWRIVMESSVAAMLAIVMLNPGILSWNTSPHSVVDKLAASDEARRPVTSRKWRTPWAPRFSTRDKLDKQLVHVRAAAEVPLHGEPQPVHLAFALVLSPHPWQAEASGGAVEGCLMYDPGNDELEGNLSVAFIDSGDPDIDADVLSRLLVRDPWRREAFYYLVVLRLGQGRPTVLERYLELDPERAWREEAARCDMTSNADLWT